MLAIATNIAVALFWCHVPQFSSACFSLFSHSFTQVYEQQLALVSPNKSTPLHATNSNYQNALHLICSAKGYPIIRFACVLELKNDWPAVEDLSIWAEGAFTSAPQMYNVMKDMESRYWGFVAAMFVMHCNSIQTLSLVNIMFHKQDKAKDT